MPATGRFFVTPHAVQRYRQHWAPGVSYEEALARLIKILEGARFVKHLDSGAELWRGPQPRKMRFIVCRGPGGELPQVVTVLDGNRRGPGMPSRQL